ncbi:DUF58 domain-containing protein [Paenibacillus sp. D2_2]|uniref:DUF58 domain-containing protein n=1 Tax=Paenibacillus sp. D2_2 TaxID=3073092 RepID=UPI002815169F|nr:DUF58 domain-containing protein [Paenibacillus sp. D2_2]WMT41436.1 DUF58 domain-containing protein [Paenibacillus sp. D2_2]
MQLTWLIVSASILIGLLALVYQRSAMKGLTYTRYFTRDTVFEGDTVEMVEVISNAKWLPLPWMRLESSIPTGLRFGDQTNLNIYSGDIYQNHISLFYLRSYRRIKRHHQVICSRRGLYHLETATLTTGDPLGLISKAQKFPLNLELLVYPEILALQELPLPNHSWIGELAVRRWIVEDPFLTSGVREYRAGDAMGSINWKATARTGALQVHKRDYTADHRLVICLNLEDSDTMWRNINDAERIELGIRYAATVADQALRSGVETGLICNGHLIYGPRESIRIEPSAAAGQLELLLTTLARLVLDRTVSMSTLLEEVLNEDPVDTDFLLISCHQGEKLRITADQLLRRGNGIEWMEIPGTGKAESAAS